MERTTTLPARTRGGGQELTLTASCHVAAPSAAGACPCCRVSGVICPSLETVAVL